MQEGIKNMGSNILLPCWYCGSRDLISDTEIPDISNPSLTRGFVECTHCNAGYITAATEEDAIREWNAHARPGYNNGSD
jgi:hypothetical protein